MTEKQTSNKNKTQKSEQSQQQLAIQKIYCKDISFETPNSPQIFTQNIKPEMKTELNTSVNVLAENGVFEVVLSVTVTAEYEEKTAFLAEVNQAAIFNVSGFDKTTLDSLLATYCPNLLFPYAREVISELVGKGGFPQLILQPVNFEAMYAQHMQAKKENISESQTGKNESVH